MAFVHMINDQVVTSPDTQTWEPSNLGAALDMTLRRSPMRVVRWTKTVAGPCDLDWFTYDNTILTTFVTRGPTALKEWTVYTDAVCQQVSMVHSGPRGTRYEAIFLVNVTP
jgi:hypothetical protein